MLPYPSISQNFKTKMRKPQAFGGRQCFAIGQSQRLAVGFSIKLQATSSVPHDAKVTARCVAEPVDIESGR